MLTGLRRGEAAAPQPRDLDFDGGTLTVRREVRRLARRDLYLFGDATLGHRPLSGFGKLLDRLRAGAGVVDEGAEPWSLHDIRRTVATRFVELGTDTLVVGDLLGHLTGARGGVAGIYNRSQTLERQRTALERSAEILGLDAARAPTNRGHEAIWIRDVET